jgi:hypothetical protein
LWCQVFTGRNRFKGKRNVSSFTGLGLKRLLRDGPHHKVHRSRGARGAGGRHAKASANAAMFATVALIVGHVLPIALLAAAGAAIGRRILRTFARRSSMPG